MHAFQTSTFVLVACAGFWHMAGVKTNTRTPSIHLVCNAHLDPLWQWEWEEGAAEAVNTYRHAADFCDEFDGFIFCHNEALLYRWVQTGGEAVSFTPDQSITEFTAPDSLGPLTFSLTVTDPAGLVAGDSTVVTVTNAGMEAEAHVTVPVQASADDAHEVKLSGLVNLGATVLNMTYKDKRIVGLRFQKVPVPQGATITGAYVEFIASAADSTAAALSIRGQAADNAPAFTTATWNLSGRAATSAVVDWAAPAWVLNKTYQSPDLAAVVQEIVDRPGWAANNALAFVISGTGQRR